MVAARKPKRATGAQVLETFREHVTTFHTDIPGGTYCENCGRLKHAHIDDHCVSKPLRSRAKRDDESVGAQRDAALASVLALARIIRKVGGYLRVEDQEALRSAEALAVAVKG